MREDEYRALCVECDRVLRAPDATMERIAIPLLHVMREHPMFLERYEAVVGPHGTSADVARRWFRTLRRSAGWLHQLVQASLCDGRHWAGGEKMGNRVDVLFVSHLLNPAHAGQDSDFYFGDTPSEVTSRGHPALVALINHTGISANALVGRWARGTVPRVVFANSLSVAAERAARTGLKKESRRLAACARQMVPGLARRVLAQAAEAALSGSARTAMRIGLQIRALVAELQPRAIVITHEGHAWERVAFAGARSARPGIRCIGYQHAAVFRLQHAIRRSLAPQYNPDLILTAGTVGRNQLEAARELYGVPVAVLGSNRVSKPETSAHATPREIDACLVLPEGDINECNVLFDFSLSCAERLPDVRFVWRLHPLMSFARLVRRNRRLRRLPNNVVVSERPFDQDVAECRWALYRGTTAIVAAVGGGLRPVYLRRPGEMTLDPLYQLEVWRVEIESAEEFVRVVERDRTGLADVSAMRAAKEYCRGFYTPFDIGALLRALDRPDDRSLATT